MSHKQTRKVRENAGFVAIAQNPRVGGKGGIINLFQHIKNAMI